MDPRVKPGVTVVMRIRFLHIVMPALVAGIHALLRFDKSLMQTAYFVGQLLMPKRL